MTRKRYLADRQLAYFAVKLKTLRLKSELTIKELAEKVGYAGPTMCSWEHCKDFPSKTAVEDVASYFGVSVAETIGEEDET